MKKSLAFVITLLLALSIGTAAMAYTTMYVYTSNGNSLNLRDAPSMIGNIMTRIPNGAAVRVNDVFDDSWYSVSYGGYTGYAMARYLVYGSYPYTPTATPAPAVTSACTTFPNDIFYGFQDITYRALVRPSNPAGYVNLRWAPSLLADIHTRYYANAILTVMSQNSLWCQVLDEEGEVMGFMMRQFLSPYYGDS